MFTFLINTLKRMIPLIRLQVNRLLTAEFGSVLFSSDEPKLSSRYCHGSENLHSSSPLGAKSQRKDCGSCSGRREGDPG